MPSGTNRKLWWLGSALFLALVMARPDRVQTQTETVRFCEAPTILPGNTPLPDYSPVVCFEYSGLKRELYKVQIHLLEASTGNYWCASGPWCGPAADPPAVFTIDNRDGTRTAGRVIDARRMDVFDYPNFLWAIDLFNEAGAKVSSMSREARATANRAPVLHPIGSQCKAPGQALEFTVEASDKEGDAVTLSAENLPPGATFNPATGQFRWQTPASAVVLFRATQGSPVSLHDAEQVRIQVGQQQTLSVNSTAYTTGEGGPAVLTINRTGGATGVAEVTYRTASQTAQAGADYTATTDTLTFRDGETSKVVKIPITNDANREEDETFTVTLTAPTNCGSLGATVTATVRIVDDDTPALAGQWTPVRDWPTVPIHMSLLPNGKVLFWDRHNHEKHWDGDPRLWDPATGAFSAVPLPGYDIFCAGHSFLADGKLLVTGGHISMPPPLDNGVGEKKTSSYDPVTNSWARLPDMNAGRWYPSNATLANGDVLVMAGTTENILTVNQLPQVWQAASGTWRDLTGARQGNFPLWANFYPYLYLAPNGKVFYAGPQQTARFLDTAGIGKWDDEQIKSSLSYRDYGSSVLYDDGKVLIVGGNPYEPDPFSRTPTILPSATAEVIDLNVAQPAWRATQPMTVGRRQHTATLLPDGTVLVTGGSSFPGFDRLAGAVYYAELWDPATEAWSILSGYERYRGYHSSALLLPDGRVLAGGGGHPDPEGGAAQNNVEIYSPPYLFKGARPTITAAPTQVTYGQTFSVQTPDAANISKVNWIRLSSVTHGFNQNQRINRFSFAPESGGLRVMAPANPNLCPPGHYLLFILNRDGVPSVGQIIQINTGAVPGTISNVSSASYNGPPLAPESIVTAFGSNLAMRTEVATSIPLPTTLAGTTVKCRDSIGVERMAQIFFVSPTQVNYQIPPGTANGAATITVTSGNGITSTGTVRIATVAPGVFTANASGQGVPAAIVLRVKENSMQSTEPVARFDAAQNRFVAVPIDLGPTTDQVFLILFGTGIRLRSDLPAVIAKIGGVDGQVTFAGQVPGFVGLDQVNVRIPRSLIGRGEVDTAMTVDSQMANMVRINIK